MRTLMSSLFETSVQRCHFSICPKCPWMLKFSPITLLGQFIWQHRTTDNLFLGAIYYRCCYAEFLSSSMYTYLLVMYVCMYVDWSWALGGKGGRRWRGIVSDINGEREREGEGEVKKRGKISGGREWRLEKTIWRLTGCTLFQFVMKFIPRIWRH